MSHEQDILDANARFYQAFSEGSPVEMENIWSNRDVITCIHPGWPSLNSRDEVLKSWRQILNADSVQISPSSPVVRCHGDLAYVICYEHLGPGTLIATNIFALENDEWRMIHHQAGPTSSQTDNGAAMKAHPTIQ